MKEETAANFRASKSYDVLMALPLMLFYGFSLAGLRAYFAAALRLKPPWVCGLQLLSLASIAFYLILVIALIFLRRLPVGRSESAWPRGLAILGSIFLFSLPLLPSAPLSPPLIGFSALLTGGAAIAELVILGWLRRSFSLMPEARVLVTVGPYRYIRHPLYLAGLIASFGAMLHFRQPWALIIVVAGFAIQIFRMHYEEQVLAHAFPQYTEYMARTWRLVPYIY